MNSSIRRNERSDITASKLQQPPHFTNPHNASKSLHEVHHSQILWFKLIGALEVPNYHYQRLRNMLFKMPHMCQHFWWLHYMLQQLTIGSSITIRINYHRLLLSHWGIGGRYTMLLAPFALFQQALTTIEFVIYFQWLGTGLHDNLNATIFHYPRPLVEHIKGWCHQFCISELHSSLMQQHGNNNTCPLGHNPWTMTPATTGQQTRHANTMARPGCSPVSTLQTFLCFLATSKCNRTAA